MKKRMLIILCLFASICLQAQTDSTNAIGLRLGDNDGIGAEVSYQRAIFDSNRIEIDLGFRNSNNINAFKLTGLYHWIWNINGGFNWYAGGGAGVVSWDNDELNTNGIAPFIAGDIGIEYDFDFPLIISLDLRPEIGFSNAYSDDLDFDIALGVRYQF